MGRATIVSGGTDGRYVIRMDYGEELKTRLLEALSLALAQLDTKISEQQGEIDLAQAAEDAQEAKYLAAVDLFISQHPFFAPGSPRPDDRAVIFELENLRKLQAKHRPLRDRLVAMKYERAQLYKRIAYWNNFVPTETRPAWCADLTEDAAPGAVVATADIPGETALIVIAPGARAPAAEDGQLMAREVMSPEQAFWNAAVLPGWQKEKPTYRWGTITALDQDADTCSVSLADAVSSARRLNVNKVTTLANVPIVYMSCNSGPFEVGSRVVVKFEGQSWDSPTVVGFLDNPRPCDWQCIGNLGGYAFFVAALPSTIASFGSESLDVRYRFNGSSWASMPFFQSDPGVSYSYKTADDMMNLSVYLSSITDAPFGRIECSVEAPLPVDVGRNVAEFAIIIAGQVAFNVATTDFGWSTGVNYRNGSVKTLGGIRSSTPVGYYPVTKLDYTLTGAP